MYRIIGGDQKEYGPASEQELKQWITEGRLSRQSLVRAEESPDWRTLESFPEFAEALRMQVGSLAGASASPGAGWAAAATEPGRLEVGRCLGQSWSLLMGNFGLLVGASALAWVLSMACQFIPLIGGLVYWLMRGAILGGLYVVFLRRIRGQPTSVGELFSPFGENFAQLMLVGLLTSLLTTLGTVCCLLLPGLYFFIAWLLAIPLVVDRRLEFWSAMELSRKVVTRYWFEMLGLVVLAFLPVIIAYVGISIKATANIYPVMLDMMNASQPDYRRLVELMTENARSTLPLILLFKVVILINLPFATGALMYAYEALLGSRPTPRA